MSEAIVEHNVHDSFHLQTCFLSSIDSMFHGADWFWNRNLKALFVSPTYVSCLLRSLLRLFSSYAFFTRTYTLVKV